MDLAEFQLIRSPRGNQPEDNIKLGPEVIIPPEPRNIVRPYIPPAQRKRRFSLANLPPEVFNPGDDPLLTPDPANDLTWFQRVYAIVNLFDEWLRKFNDRVPPGEPPADHPSGEKISKLLTDLLKLYELTEADWLLASKLVLLGYHDALKALIRTDPKPIKLFEKAVILTRRVHIASLIGRRLADLNTLDENSIYDLLNQKTVSLMDVDQATAAPTAKVELIREAKVADLHVVRREWACYIPSEVANIRNMMAGESFTHTLKNTRERETTEVTEEERREQTEQEDQTRLESELSSEVNSQLAISINGHFDASVEYKMPTTTTNISGGADGGLSIERSERHASKIAREAVSRAVSRIDARTRESRTVRELTRTEDTTEYSITNGIENSHAIYRWVDRVDRYQVFRYPDRLLLEFQLPEPAEFYRWRRSKQLKSDAAGKEPPEWKLVQDDIKPENLIKLAADYHATNLPALPDEKTTIARIINVELGAENLPKDGNAIWNLPSTSKDVEIPIPTDYAAVSLKYSGHGSPIWAKWHVGSTTGGSETEGFHGAFAVVGVASTTEISWASGIRYLDPTPNGPEDWESLASYGNIQDIGLAYRIQFGPKRNNAGTSIYTIPYGRAMLIIGTDKGGLQPGPVEITFNPGAVSTIKAVVSTTGLASCVVTFEVTCKRTDQALMQWQLDVYDALYAAWSQWNEEWESAQQRQALLGMTGADAGTSLRNEQIIREELKRQVIAWLLDESPFNGRPALKAQAVGVDGKAIDDFRETDFTKAIGAAPTIQFLEQAFEWTNMSYVFYPYYWADREQASKKWTELSQIQATDAEFERFLRAGSARVVVPARPGFNEAVNNWLLYQVPFISGQLPSIGKDDPLYISIDREIRNLTSPWQGGYAEDFWESRMSTTMLYLETQDELPISNDNAQLPAEIGKLFEPKLVCEP